MPEHLSWKTVEEAMDRLEADDKEGIVEVFRHFEGLGLNVLDRRGLRQTVNLSTFSMHFGFNRKTFVSWVRAFTKETA